MVDSSDSNSFVIERKQKLVLMAAVVVLLGMGVAISGWIIISALNNIGDEDPFTLEREYDVTGICTLDGADHACTGEIVTSYSSETSAYCVFMYDLSYGYNSNTYKDTFSLMFDSDRNPTKLFTYLGDKGGYSLWKGTDNGVDVIYYFDSGKTVQKMDIDDGRATLAAVLKA